MTSENSVSPGGDRRTVTVTFGYGEHLRTLVAKTLREALTAAEARWGRWETIESVSSPDTIFADLTGLTKARQQPGVNHGGNPNVASKLRGIGYEPKPGEVATVGYYREELPRQHRRAGR